MLQLIWLHRLLRPIMPSITPSLCSVVVKYGYQGLHQRLNYSFDMNALSRIFFCFCVHICRRCMGLRVRRPVLVSIPWAVTTTTWRTLCNGANASSWLASHKILQDTQKLLRRWVLLTGSPMASEIPMTVSSGPRRTLWWCLSPMTKTVAAVISVRTRGANILPSFHTVRQSQKIYITVVADKIYNHCRGLFYRCLGTNGTWRTSG